MMFDLICLGCGACTQRTWDPTGLTGVLEVIQGAGILPVAVERHARGQLQAEAA
jgi:hypothetical protein